MEEYTVTQYAELEGISRQAALKRISKGQVKARKEKTEWIVTVEEKDSKKRFNGIINKVWDEIQLLELIRDGERELTKDETQAYEFYYKVFEGARKLEFYEEMLLTVKKEII